MYPVTVTIRTDAELKAVHAALSGLTPEAAEAPAATPAKVTKAKAAPAAVAAPAQTATVAPANGPVATGVVLSAAGQAFLQSQLADPVMKLCMKDEPKMKAILAEYGVERVSLVPEAKFPELLVKVNDALDPGAEERKRLEALDKSTQAAKSLI